MHLLTVFLGLIAALLSGAAYLLYAFQTRLGKSSPKSASWGLWAFLCTINALTFHGMSGDVSVALQFFMGSVACIVVFLYMLAIGKLSWPKPSEWLLFGLGLLSVLVWLKFRSAAGGNVIIFIAFVISFIPTYEAIWENPYKEVPRSWILWTTALLFTAMNVILNWKGQPLSLLMPIGGAFLHIPVAILSSDARKKRFLIATMRHQG